MKTILLIEDDNTLRENTKEILELSKYKVITAPNGRIGIKQALEHIPDIIICDIMMPEVDGYGVLQELSSQKTTKHIPFIFLSAKTEHKEIRKGMDLGADDYLTKPFDEDDLISAIESRLAKAILFTKKKPSVRNEKTNSKEELHNLNELKNFFDDNGEPCNFKAGEIIYNKGDHSNKIYFIVKGIVKCHKMDEDGKELITSLHPADEFLGFTSFKDVIPYLESATAVNHVELVSITKEHLKSILEKNHRVSIDLMELLADNLMIVKEQLLQMAYSSVRKKTAQTLLQFSEILNTKADKPIKVSRSDLASVAGIATESLIRTLSIFKKEGVIGIEGRNIKILDLKKLEDID